MIKFTTLQQFGKAFIPERLRPGLRKYLSKTGVVDIPYTLYGSLFILSVIITAILYLLFIFPRIREMYTLAFLLATFITWVITQLLVIAVIIAGLYIFYDLRIFKRTKEMEEVLEDFLRYVSENLKGGLPVDRALWQAIRPQFKVLADEINLVAKKVTTGSDVGEALMEFTDKYDSPDLKRSFQLIVEGMKGGGEISSLIDKIEQNLRETRDLKKEMSATNATYVIYLGAIILAIAPALFGLSFNLLKVLDKLSAKLSPATGASSSGGMGMMMDFSKLNVAKYFNNFIMFSILALVIIGVFASMIMSIIRKGNIKEGLKYIPPMVGGSIVMYYIFRIVLEKMFGSFIV